MHCKFLIHFQSVLTDKAKNKGFDDKVNQIIIRKTLLPSQRTRDLVHKLAPGMPSCIKITTTTELKRLQTLIERHTKKLFFTEAALFFRKGRCQRPLLSLTLWRPPPRTRDEAQPKTGVPRSLLTADDQLAASLIANSRTLSSGGSV